MPSVQETSYLSRPEGRIGYDVASDGSLVVLVPGMGDLRAGYRFLAPALRAAGYRAACTDLRGHGDSDAALRAAMAPPWAALLGYGLKYGDNFQHTHLGQPGQPAGTP